MSQKQIRFFPQGSTPPSDESIRQAISRTNPASELHDFIGNDEAVKKLSTGRGNVIRQAEMLRELGVKPTKQLLGFHFGLAVKQRKNAFQATPLAMQKMAARLLEHLHIPLGA